MVNSVIYHIFTEQFTFIINYLVSKCLIFHFCSNFSTAIALTLFAILSPLTLLQKNLTDNKFISSCIDSINI